MTREDIIRMAIECQLVTTNNRDGIYMEALERFAALVAAAEREQCERLKHQKKAKPATSEWFAQFRNLYPERAGDQDWQQALKAANARIAEGHTPDEFIKGAMRYRAFCERTGKLGTEHVKQAVSFLGPDKAFAIPWSLPKTKAETQQDTIRARGER
jgi:hypothetical protein